MSNYIITGHTGEPHVTAVQQRRINAGLSGSGRYILPVGGNLACSYIGSNTVRVSGGVARINGMDVGIDPGTYVDLAISNGTQGVARNDLVVIRYTKDQATGIEVADFVIVTGTPGAGDPSLTQGSLIDGTTLLDETALARVVVTGTTISSPVMLLPRGGPAKRLDDMDTSFSTAALSTPAISSANVTMSSTSSTALASVAQDGATIRCDDAFVSISSSEAEGTPTGAVYITGHNVMVAATNRFSVNGWALPAIQRGHSGVTIAANSWTDFLVDFPASFASAPEVVITPRHPAGTASIQYKIVEVTASGFRAAINSGTAGTYQVMWIAMA